MSGYYEFKPSIYATYGEPTNKEYPVLKSEIANFCDYVSDYSQRVINRSREFNINDFIPKVKFRVFGAFSSTTINGEKRDSNEMDGSGRVISVFAGGMIAAIASFIFGAFYSDYQEACIRLDRCETLRDSYEDVWQIHNHPHIKDLKFVVDNEEKQAKEVKKSAIINMAMTIVVIASGAMLIVAGIFASMPIAIASVVAAVAIGVFAMAKFGVNFFDKMPIAKSKLIEEAIVRLKAADSIIVAKRTVLHSAK